MLAKSSWFSVRKYGGWGLTPNCWQGWLYLALIVVPVIFVKSTPFLIVWAIVFGLDFLTIFFTLKKDERESAHEAIAERNAMWFMVAALGAGVAYQAATSVVRTSFAVDPVILVALLGATLVKAITNFYLRDK